MCTINFGHDLLLTGFHTVAKSCIVILNWSSLFPYSAVITDYDYVFSENGLVAHKNGELIGTQVSLWAPQACLVSSDGLNINKFNCKKMLVKKAKSTRTSDFSMFLYMLILNFCFLQSLKSFLREDKLKVSLCGVFIFFH